MRFQIMFDFITGRSFNKKGKIYYIFFFAIKKLKINEFFIKQIDLVVQTLKLIHGRYAPE